MIKKFLEKLKEKIITVEHFTQDGIIMNNCILVDYDDKFLILRSYMGSMFLSNLSYIISIHKANNESEKKFKSYIEQYNKNKKFKGDTKERKKQIHSMYG